MRVHLFIATTAGPVRVQSIRRFKPFDDGPANASHAAVDGEGAARFSARYREFVDFVIAPRIRHRCFLVSVERDIEQGESWRLALFLGHELEATAAGMMANADPVEAGDFVVLATGRLSNELAVRQVQGMADKFGPATQERIDGWRTAGANVIVAVPKANAPEMNRLYQRPAGVVLLAIERGAELLRELPFLAGDTAEAIASAAPASRRGVVLAVAAGMIAIAAIALAWLRPDANNAVPSDHPQPSADEAQPASSRPREAIISSVRDRAETTLVAVRGTAGDCDPDRAGRIVRQRGDNFDAIRIGGLCGMVLRPARDVTAAAWLSLSPLGRPPVERRGDGWWLPPPSTGGQDRQLALVLAAVPGDQAQLDAWLDAWLAGTVRNRRPAAHMQSLRANAAAAPWPLRVYGHTLEAF